MKTHPMMIPRRFILMAKLLIYQLRFQSAVRCAKTGPRKENPFVSVEGWRGCRNFSNLRPDFIREGVRLAKTMEQPTKQNNLKRKQKIGDERLRKRCLFSSFFLSKSVRENNGGSTCFHIHLWCATSALASMSDLRYGGINSRLTFVPVGAPSSLCGVVLLGVTLRRR